MTAPDIRGAVQAWMTTAGSSASGDTARAALVEAIQDAANVLDVAAFAILDSDDTPEPDEGSIWCDLRPSEALVLRRHVLEARKRAERRCEAIIVAELTRAGERFAAAFPEAPRLAEAAT